MIVIIVFGLVMQCLFGGVDVFGVFVFIIFGLGLMGFIFGLMVVLLFEFFFIEVCYFGVLLVYNLVFIVGVLILMLVVLELNKDYGLQGVGLYLVVNGLFMLVVLWFLCEMWDLDLVVVR